MNWEETIKYIRTQPSYNYLIEKSYLDENLLLNIQKFKNNEEYLETINLIKCYFSEVKSILDVGSGNGISCISFALDGYNVTAVEPNKSDTIGTGAISKLKNYYELSNIEIIESYAENIDFPDETFDLVYIRQTMHHANNLEKFIQECSRVLKKKGGLITTRDHVIFDSKDKKLFLETHPLQKFYGGENAFTPSEYKDAFRNAGLKIIQEIKFFDNVINYFPISKLEKEKLFELRKKEYLSLLENKIGLFSRLLLMQYFYFVFKGFSRESVYNEKKIPGRMYSYIVAKE